MLGQSLFRHGNNNQQTKQKKKAFYILNINRKVLFFFFLSFSFWALLSVTTDASWFTNDYGWCAQCPVPWIRQKDSLWGRERSEVACVPFRCSQIKEREKDVVLAIFSRNSTNHQQARWHNHFVMTCKLLVTTGKENTGNVKYLFCLNRSCFCVLPSIAYIVKLHACCF